MDSTSTAPCRASGDLDPEVCHYLEEDGGKPFDPVELAKITARFVCDGNRRKYSRFDFTRDYYWGVATGYCYGCCLRCVFCWAAETRDHARDEAMMLTPAEAVARMEEVAKRRRLDQARISEGEPTIGREHLLGVLEGVQRSRTFRRFFLETNGIPLGADEDYVRELAQFDKLWIRVALKAGTPEQWMRKTGATPESFHLPFQALSHIKRHGMQERLSVAAMSRDPRFMSQNERVMLISELARVDPQMVLDLNEEMVVTHRATMTRLERVGFPVRRYIPIPGLWRILQVAYRPMKTLRQKRVSPKFSLSAIKNLFFGT